MNGTKLGIPLTKKPKRGDLYYFITTTNLIRGNVWRDDVVDEQLFQIGNMFDTHSSAVAHRDMLQDWRKHLKEERHVENPV